MEEKVPGEQELAPREQEASDHARSLREEAGSRVASGQKSHLQQCINAKLNSFFANYTKIKSTSSDINTSLLTVDELRGRESLKGRASPSANPRLGTKLHDKEPHEPESAPSLIQSMERNKQLFREIEQRAEEEDGSPKVKSSQTMQNKASKPIKAVGASKHPWSQDRANTQSEVRNPKKRGL